MEKPKLEYGAWAPYDPATRTYKVRVIDRRGGGIRFVELDMPEFTRDGVRRIDVVTLQSTYVSVDGYNMDWALTTNWRLEDGRREMYRDMLDEVMPLNRGALSGGLV